MEDRRIGDKIRGMRKKRGLTQEDLAKNTGLNIGTIRGYEQGKYEPKKEALYKLRKALDVPISYFIEECEDEKKVDEKPKTITEIIEEVADKICNDYCRYADTTDVDGECEAFRRGLGCPLEKLL